MRHREIALKSMNLVAKDLPIGLLKKERIMKANQALDKLQRWIMRKNDGSATATEAEKQIENAQADFYGSLPFNFGIKKPPGIDHLIKVKESHKKMDLLWDIYTYEQTLVNSLVS